MAQAVRDYKQLALDILKYVGGEKNITSAARCATRLRLVLRETPPDAHEKIAALPGVITVVEQGGQFQVVIGPHISDVFAVVSKELRLDEKPESTDAVPQEKQSIVNQLMQVLSGTFAPICYILAGAGLLRGILIVITTVAGSVGGAELVSSITAAGTYRIFDFIGQTPFYFLPVLVGCTASKHFKCNQFIAVVCCLALVYPDFTALAGSISAENPVSFLMIPLTATTYTSSVLPPLIVVWLLSYVEKFFTKHLPAAVSQLFTPVLCFAIMVPLTIVLVGPAVYYASLAISTAYEAIYAAAPWLAGALIAGVWSVVVIFGVHWSMGVIISIAFSPSGVGYTSLLTFTTIAVIAQMAAAFAVALRTRSKDLRVTALSAGITAIFGITEPAIYGVTLPRKKPFIFACIGAALGALAAAFFGTVYYSAQYLPGLITIFQTLPDSSTVNPNPLSFAGMLVGAGIAIAVTMGLTIVLDKDPVPQGSPAETSEELAPAESAPAATGGEVYSPLRGQVRSLSQVNDPTFAEEILGKGVAIFPEEGKLYAPFDGQVVNVADTRHAINLVSDSGIEMLIHIGLETVRLNGTHYQVKVADGDRIRKGDLLIEFDTAEIGKEYDLITPVIVVNADEFSGIITEKLNLPVREGERILTVNP